MQQVIASTATQWDQWGNSDKNGNSLKIVKHAVSAFQKSWELIVQYDGIINDDEVSTHESNVKNLKKICKTYMMV